jgi:hypothetical protein
MFDADAIAMDFMVRHGIKTEVPGNTVLVAYTALSSATYFQRVPNLTPKAIWDPLAGTIRVRTGMSPVADAYLVGHEAAHCILNHALRRTPEMEREADALSAAFIAPLPAVRIAVKHWGRHLPTLARHFNTTQSIMLLRLGEVFRAPIALVTPRRIHVRGDESIVWPSDTEIRRFASGRRNEPWMSRETLSDQPRHVALTLVA